MATTNGSSNGVYITDEVDLEAKREILRGAGIAEQDFSQYITTPEQDATGQGRLYFKQPVTLTSPLGEETKRVATGSVEANNLMKNGWSISGGINSDNITSPLLTPEANITIGDDTTANGYLADQAKASMDVDIKETDAQIQRNLELITQEETPLSKQVQDLLTDIGEDADTLTGRGAAQLEEERKRGIEQQNQAMADKNTELKKKIAEIDALTASYNLANQQEEGKPQTLSRLQGAQAQNYKMYLAQKNALTAEASYLQAGLLGMQGKLEAAQSAADRAVELEYMDRQSAYNAKIAQLNILQPQLEKKDAKYATALKMTFEQQANDIKVEIADKKQQSDFALKQMDKYPDAGITLNDDIQTINNKVKSSASFLKDFNNELLGNLTSDQISQLNVIQGQIKTDPDIKGFIDIRDSYKRVLVSAEEPSAAGDLSLIFNYMKMLDPGSVVRESEFANAAATGSLGQRFIATGQKLLEGERLSDVMRNDFLNRSNRLYDAKVGSHKDAVEFYGNQLDRFGIPRDAALRDYIGGNNSTINLSPLDVPYVTLNDLVENKPQYLDLIEDILKEDPTLSDGEVQEEMNKILSFSGVDSDTYKAASVGMTPTNIKIGAGWGVKNNNPGNLRLAGQFGATQGGGNFAKFETPQAGWEALINDIEAKKASGGKLDSNSTLSEMIAVYAPKEDNNDPASYAQTVARNLGISINTPIGKIDTYQLAKAIAKHESSTVIT